MNRKIITVAIFLIFSCFGLALSQTGNDMGFETLPNIKYIDEYAPYFKDAHLDFNFVFPSTYPEVTSEMIVYKKNDGGELSFENMKKVGDIFNMGDGCEVENIHGGGNFYTNDNGDGIEFKGDLNLYEYEDYTVKPEEGVSLPTEQEAKNFAETYLHDKGLWNDSFEFEESTEDLQNIPQIKVKYKMETFVNNSRKFGDVTLTIIPGNKIKSVLYEIIESEAYATVKTITPREAIDRINQGNAYFYFNQPPSSKTAIVDVFALSYVASGRDAGDNSIKYYPSYTLSGHTEDGVEFSIEVSAVKDYYLKKREIFAKVTIEPETLNLQSAGRWIECEIKLPVGYRAEDVDLSKLAIVIGRNQPVPCDPSTVEIEDDDEREGERNDGHKAKNKRDHDGEHSDDEHGGELEVKFSRAAVQALLGAGERVPIYVQGMIGDKPLRGIDYIRVIE